MCVVLCVLGLQVGWSNSRPGRVFGSTWWRYALLYAFGFRLAGPAPGQEARKRVARRKRACVGMGTGAATACTTAHGAVGTQANGGPGGQGGTAPCVHAPLSRIMLWRLGMKYGCVLLSSRSWSS